MNIKTILCPTDFSHHSDAALQFASTLASESGAFLYIVFVDEGSPTYVPGYGGYGYVPDPTEAREKHCREQLSKIKPTVEGVEFGHRYLTGAPEKKILEFAKQEDVDLIVMGTHGRTGVSRVLMGSIAEGVVRHAKCPVLTVKQPAEQNEEVAAAQKAEA